MIVGTILLSKNNRYIGATGLLPKRPKFDKKLLTELLAYNGEVSNAGYNLLPLSIKARVVVRSHYNVPITIKELNNCDLLIVSRSKERIKGGKKFRFKNFKNLVKTKKVEIWISIN